MAAWEKAITRKNANSPERMPDVPADTPSVTIVALRATKRIRRRDNGLLLPACKEYLSLQGGALGLHSPHDVLKVPNAAREPVDPRDHQHNAPLDVGSASDALTGYAAARSIRRSSIRLPVLNCAVSQRGCLPPLALPTSSGTFCIRARQPQPYLFTRERAVRLGRLDQTARCCKGEPVRSARHCRFSPNVF